MRTLSFALLVLALAAASAYVRRKEYIYDYETLTVTSVPVVTNQVNGLKLRCRLRAQFMDEAHKVWLKVDHAELLKINEVLPTVTTPENEPFIPEELLEVLNGPEVEDILEQLYKPVMLRYDGVVTELEVERSEPEWSVNIKRGFVSLLNLNLRETDAILEDVPLEIRDRYLMPNSPALEQPARLVYSAMETDPIGECETIYALRERTEGLTVPELNVTKIRNYHSCIKKPIMNIGLLATLEAAQSIRSMMPIETTTHVDYKLSGSRESFVIEKALLRGDIVYLPLGVNQGEMVATTRSKLELVRREPITEAITRPLHMRETPPLLMQLLTTVPATTDTDTVNTATTTRVELVKTLVEDVITLTEPFVDITVPEKMSEIVFILKELPLTELEELIRFYTHDLRTTEEVALRKKEIILDVLPTLGRVDLVPLIRTLRRDDVISTLRTIYMLNKLLISAYPSPVIVTDLLDFLDEPIVHTDIALKKTIMLTTGSMVYKVKESLRELHMDDTLHQISELITRRWELCTTDAEKLMWIKTMGNTGLLKLVPLLETIILDTSLPPLIREKAIYSLRRMTTLLWKKVQTLCLPIYLNRLEPVEIRTAAFLMIMRTRPCPTTLETIAHSLKTETSLNMATFVYTYLEELAMVKPNLHTFNMTFHLRYILTTLPPIRAGLVYSRTIRMEKMVDFLGHLGVGAEIHLLNDGTSFLPEAMVMKLSHKRWGNRMEGLELGIESAGLSTLLQHLSTSDILSDILEGKVSLEQLLHPFNTPIIYAHIQEIAEQLMMADRPLEVLDLRIYAKLFGNEVAFFHLDTEYLEEMLDLVRESLPEVMDLLLSGRRLNWLETLALTNEDRTMPLVNGLPLTMNLSMVAVGSVQGNLHLTGISSILDLLTPSALSEIKLIPDIKTSMAVEMTAKLCIHLPYYKFTTELRTQLSTKLPLKSELALDLHEKKIKFTYDIPETDVTLFDYKLLPLTRVIKLLKTPTTQLFFTEDLKEFTVHDFVLPGTVNMLVGESFLGVPLKVSSLYQTSSLPTKKFWTISWTEHLLKVELIRADIVPTKLDLELTLLDYELIADMVQNVFKARREELSYRSAVHSSPLALTFDTVTPDPILVNPKLLKMLLVLKPIGGNLQKEMKMQMTYLMDALYLKHQLNIQMLTTPLISTMTTPLKVVMETVLMIPELLREGLPLALTEKELLLATTLKYGCTDMVGDVITFKTFLGPVPNSELLLRTEWPVLTPELRQQFSQILIEPALFLHLRPIMPELQLTNDLPHTPIALTFEVTYVKEMLPVALESLWLKTYVIALKYLPTGPIPDVMAVINTPNKIELIAVLTPVKTMILALLPTETIILRPVPVPLSFLFPVETTSNSLSRALYMTQEAAALPAGQCKVQGSELTTFDFLEYSLPEMPECEMLLTQDCTPRRQFAITMKQMTGSTKKILTLYLGTHTVELTPTSSGWFSSAGHQVKVDGARVTVTTHRPYIHTHGTHGAELFRIVKEEGKLKVICPLAPTIMTDLTDVLIQEGELFRGQLCGLCGDFNSDAMDDLTGPRLRPVETPAQLVASYIIPSDTCRTNPEL